MPSVSPFPKDEIAVLEKQIDRLRKEVDDRMSSNHTLWRAGLAGVGAFILFKEALDLNRVVLALPILCMGLGAHWLNQLVTLYRSGDALAACETRINAIAGAELLNHEILLAQMRKRMLLTWRGLFIGGALAATVVYWVAMWQVQPLASDRAALLYWRVGLLAALLVNLAAAVNLKRFLSFAWPALAGIHQPTKGAPPSAA